VWRLSGERGFCSGRRGVCVASKISIKINFLERGYRKERGVLKKGLVEEDCLRPLALYTHTKFEVSNFSRSGDTRVITDRITDIITGLHSASFTYIGRQRQKMYPN